MTYCIGNNYVNATFYTLLELEARPAIKGASKAFKIFFF